jgi:DNA repair protein RadA/Sms
MRKSKKEGVGRRSKCARCGDSLGRDACWCEGCRYYNFGLGGTYDKPLVRLGDAVSADLNRVQTGPWDLIFGGGLVDTSVTLIGAVPGCGKTTLALQACDQVCEDTGKEALFIASEQLVAELKTYADRLHLRHTKRFVTIATLGGYEELGNLEAIAKHVKPGIIVLDSLPGLCGDEHDIAVEMCEVLKKEVSAKIKAPSIVVDHVTKAHEMAGLMALQHAVDVLAIMDRDEDSGLRSIYTRKNRFGRANVKMTLEMTEHGLVAARGLPEDEDEDEDGDGDEDGGRGRERGRG